MRDELHLMELVDRYLDGSMSAEERAVFEQRAETTSDLRHLIGDQRALREGLERAALRAVVVRSAPGAGNGWFGPILGAALMISIVSYVWLARTSERPNEVRPVPEEQAVPASGESVPADPLITEQVRVDRRDPVLRTDTIVRVDTQIRVVQLHVAADISEERKQAIMDSVRSSVAAADVSVVEAQQIMLQNILTPNGDGHNDWLIVPGGPYRSATMRIRSPKNIEIFSATSSAPTWHGQLPDGRRAEAGIYTIEVQATGLDNRHYVGKDVVHLSWPEAPMEMRDQ